LRNGLIDEADRSLGPAAEPKEVSVARLTRSNAFDDSLPGVDVKQSAIGGLAVIAYVAMIGCGASGPVRVSAQQLPGTYTATFDSAKEQLVLRADKTYTQSFSSPKRQFTNQGTWESSNEFLGGTVVELQGANLSEEDPPGAPFRYGTLDLPVHKDAGKLKLAWLEAADLYFERVE